jgi:hypothetical protein
MPWSVAATTERRHLAGLDPVSRYGEVIQGRREGGATDPN